MNRRFFSYGLQISGRIVYTIWYDNDYSGFQLTQSGLILAFGNLLDINKYAAEVNIELVEMDECITHDFDVIDEWLKAPKGKTVKCSEFLNLYNLAGDFRNSLAERNLDIEDKSYPDLLEKLFWGCNNQAVTPAGKKFTPIWTKAEVRALRRVMRESLLVFNKNLDFTHD
jgi:hypothetical protein